MRGTTLLELLVVLTLMGLLTGLGGWRLSTLRDTLAVEAATAEILTAYQRARLEALATARPVRLSITARHATAWVLEGDDSVLAWTAPGPAIHGVGVTQSVDRVLVTPAGTTMGAANGRYVLERGACTRIVIVSRLGRLRVTRPRRVTRRCDPRGVRPAGPPRSVGPSG